MLTAVLATAALPGTVTASSFGTPVCQSPSEQGFPQIAVDGHGRALLVWRDTYGNLTPVGGVKVSVRQQGGDLESGWAPNGNALTPPDVGCLGIRIVWLASGVSLCAWTERPPGGSYRVRCNWLDTRGGTVAIPDTARSLTLVEGATSVFLVAMTALDSVHVGLIAYCSPAPGSTRQQSREVIVTSPFAYDATPIVWSYPDTSVGAVCTAIASDGAGGSFVSVFRAELGGYTDVVQRISPLGNTAEGWPVGGVPVYTDATGSTTYDDVLAADGAGGCYFGWRANFGGLWRALGTRLDSTGAIRPAWAPYLPLIGSGSSQQTFLRLSPLPAGAGVIACCVDDRDNYPSIRARAISASGDSLPNWPLGGVALNTLSTQRVESCALAPAPQGGALLAWTGALRVIPYPTDLFLNGVGSDALPLPGYAPAGNLICGAPDNQLDVDMSLAPDTGLAYLVWTDFRDDPFGDIFYAVVDNNGVVPTLCEVRLVATAVTDSIVTTTWTDNGTPDCEGITAWRIDGSGDLRFVGALVPIGAGSMRLTERIDGLPDSVAYVLHTPEGRPCGAAVVGVRPTGVHGGSLTLVGALFYRDGVVIANLDTGFANAMLRFDLYDLQGRRVASDRQVLVTPGRSTVRIAVPHLSQGIYVLQARCKDQRSSMALRVSR